MNHLLVATGCLIFMALACTTSSTSGAGAGTGGSATDGGTDADADSGSEGPCPGTPLGDPICIPDVDFKTNGCFCNGSESSAYCAADGCSYECDPCLPEDAGLGGAGGTGGTGGAGSGGGAGSHGGAGGQ